MLDQQSTGTSHRPVPKKAHTRYASSLLAAIGFLANVTAIAGLVTSHANTIIITAAVLGVLCGLYLLLKRWGKPVGWYTMMATAIIVAGSVMLSLALKDRHDGAEDSTGNNSVISTNGSNSSTNTPSSGKPVSKTSNHTPVFEKSFKLTSQEGLELDDEKGTIRMQQSAAKAPIDIYLSNYPMLYVSIKHFYTYQAPENPTGNTDKDQYTSCLNLINTSQLGNSYISASSVVPGQQYCLITTGGRVALITMQEIIDDGYDSPNNNASFTVKLWN